MARDANGEVWLERGGQLSALNPHRKVRFDALSEDAPGVAGLVAVLLEGAPELQVVVGVLLTDAEGLQAGQLLGSSHFSLVTASPFDVPWRVKRFLRPGDRAGTRGCGTTDLPWLTVGVACGRAA
jgi:hypothetical protein